MPTSDQEVLSILLDADVQAASKKVAGFQKELDRAFKKAAQSVEKLGATTDKANKKSAKGVEDLVDAYEEESRTVNNLSRILDSLNRKAEKASGSELKTLQKQIKETKTLFAARTAATKSGIKENAKAVKEQHRQAKAGAKKAKGVFDTLFEGTSIGKKSKEMRESGSKMTKRGGAVGKLGGKMGGAGGGALKGIGKALGGVGKLVGVFAKIVPVVSAVGSAVMAIVKLFLDADAHVKEFNKSILTLAGTNEFLGSTTKGTTGDFQKMKRTLDDIRSTAEEFWFNNDWGIMPEDHVKVLNVFNQEGVSLRAMAAEADRAYDSTRAYQQELMAVSVAYSRAFGVPMQEINTLQAELMTEMGMGLEDTKLAFAQMSRAAADSGIASNKFFAMIRGVSSDLSLYNLRLGSAVKLLGMLGKVMNPRDAQKFMQFAMQGLKGMSQDDRLKLNLLAGGKGKGIIKKDLANRSQALADGIVKAVGTKDEKEIARIKNAVESGDAMKEISKITDKSKIGTLTGAAIELQVDKTAAGKGAYGEAFAMENLGAGGSLEMMQAALAKFGGGKTLIEGAGSLGMGKMAENLGIGTEQLRGMMKLEVAIQQEKDALLAKATSDEQKQKIRDMSAQDVIDGMNEDQQKALKHAADSEMDLMKQQTDLQQSVMDQLTRLLDFIMNQVYGVLSSILDSFIGLLKKLDVFGSGKPTVEKLRDLEAETRGMQEGPMKEALMKVMKDTAGQSVEQRFAALVDATKKEDEKKRAADTKAAYEKQLGLDELLRQKSDEERKATEVGGLQSLDVKKMAGEAGVTDPAAIKKLEDLQGRVQAAGFTGDNKTMAAFHEEMVKALEPFKKSAESLGVIPATTPGSTGVFGEGMTLVDEKGQPLDLSKGIQLFSGAGPGAKMLEPAPIPAGLLPAGVQVDPMKFGQPAGPAPAGAADAKQMAAELLGPMPGAMPLTKTGEPDYAALFTEGSEPQALMAKTSQETADNTTLTVGAIEDQTKKMTQDGTIYTRFSTSFLKGEYKTVVAEAMLDSMRLALFEYFLYSNLEPEDVAKALVNNGISGPEFAKSLGEAAPSGQTAKDLFGLEGGDDDDEDGDSPPPGGKPKAPKPAPKAKKQHGGMVRRINQQGLAEFEPRSGEGLTAIGPGEQIVPAYNRGKGGGGPQQVVVSLKGDAMRLFQVMVTDGIYENKRRERNN